MEIRLKNKPLAYFSNNPALVVTCMFIIVIALVIAGACQKEIILLDDMAKTQIVTFKSTVKDVLEQHRIELKSKDKISPDLESIVTNRSKIVIKRAVPVKVVMDGKETLLLSAEETVGDVLATEHIAYGKTDKVYPEKDVAVSKDMEIKVVRVTEKEFTEKQVLAYTNEVEHVQEWEVGVEELRRDGANGEKETKIKIIYEDGMEKKREIVEEKIIKLPMSRLLAVGTLDTRIVSRGETIQFKKMLVMKATSYTDDIACTGQIGGNTFTGTKPRRISGGGKWSTVAVDPRVIPLGTRLWVEGYGYAIAEDTGGAVKGNIIDLFFTQNTQEYLDWSTRRTKVYILK